MARTSTLKPLGIAQLVVAVLLIVGVLTFAGPCVHDNGTLATCANASWGLIGGGVMLAGVGLAQMVVEGKTAGIVCAVLCIVLGVFIFFVPGTILPLCMMDTMHCQAVMKPFAQICAAIAVILGIASAVVAFRSR